MRRAMGKVVHAVSGGAFGSYLSNAVPNGGLPAFAPAVPATTVAVANPSTLPMTVVITGGTMTAVVVNGVTAGAGAGTYVVPGLGSISMTYTVAPTWAWSYVPVFLAALNANGTPVAATGA